MNSELPSGTRGPFQVVIIHGCLPPGEPLWAVAGSHEWLREPGEDLESFAFRTAAAARELKEQLLVLGGLSQTDSQHELEMAAYDAWLLTDDGVPPMEQSWAGPRRSFP